MVKEEGKSVMIEHFAEDYPLIMGIVDLVPVILFALAGCIIIKVMFNVLKKPFAVLVCSGITLSLTAGLFKAVWKILLSLNVCDFYPFNIMFMPTQSLGFVLIGIGLISLLFDKEKRNGTTAAVSTLPLLLLASLAEPAKLVDGNIAFIAMLVIGEIMIATTLSYLSIKNKKWICLVLFIVSFICLMVMGAMKPLSSKMGMSVTLANWVEESVNILAQLSLLVGCYLLNKTGFFAYQKTKN